MFALVVKHWKAALLAVAVIALAVYHEIAVIKHNAEVKKLQSQFDSQTKELGLVKGENESLAEIAKHIPQAAEIIKAGGRPEAHVGGNAKITETITAPPVKEANGSIEWSDPAGRFHLKLPEGVFTRSQRFKFDGTIFVGPDGQTRYADVRVRELNPTTGAELPSDGIVLETNLQVAKDEPVASPFHLRWVALFGAPGAGLGVQVNPWKGLILTTGGAYGSKDGLAGVAGLGWRIRLPWFDSTLGVSGMYSYSKHGSSFGPAATVELTR